MVRAGHFLTGMNRALKFRLSCFALAIAVLASLIGWAAYASWREMGLLQSGLNTGHLRSFEIADHLQVTILRLHNSLVRYDLDRSPKDFDQFQRASVELNEWIDTQKPMLQSARERELLNQIDASYDIFLAAATNGIHVTEQRDRLTHLDAVQSATVPLLELGYKLADAHRETLADSLVASQKSVSLLRWVIFGSLLLLISALVWLSATVYREMITPLQLKLVQSHAIIERQEKLASLGVLAAGVAHEIRNPLTAIKARLFSHQRSLDKSSPQFQDVLVIGNEINRLEAIVKDFLQFARPADPQLTVMDAHLILREVRDLLAPELEKQSIQLTIGGVSPNHFRADARQLKQVLINLVQNAAESIQEGGQIILRAREDNARLNGHVEPVIILETEDTGKGIPVEVQKRLFDPFFSTKETGTGLGLSIAARIVEKHGGALEFQTQPNHGTIFGIVLPVCSAQDVAA